MLNWCFIRRGRLRDTAEIGKIRRGRGLFVAGGLGAASFKGLFYFYQTKRLQDNSVCYCKSHVFIRDVQHSGMAAGILCLFNSVLPTDGYTTTVCKEYSHEMLRVGYMEFSNNE